MSAARSRFVIGNPASRFAVTTLPSSISRRPVAVERYGSCLRILLGRLAIWIGR